MHFSCCTHTVLLLLQVDVHLVVNKNPRVSESDRAEVTVFAKGTVIRATESSDSMYASIDLVTDTIARKLRKYKERNVTQKRSRTSLRLVDSPLALLTDMKNSYVIEYTRSLLCYHVIML
jgi:putative sigma-54 modulation protein